MFFIFSFPLFLILSKEKTVNLFLIYCFYILTTIKNNLYRKWTKHLAHSYHSLFLSRKFLTPFAMPNIIAINDIIIISILPPLIILLTKTTAASTPTIICSIDKNSFDLLLIFTTLLISSHRQTSWRPSIYIVTIFM